MVDLSAHFSTLSSEESTSGAVMAFNKTAQARRVVVRATLITATHQQAVARAVPVANTHGKRKAAGGA